MRKKRKKATAVLVDGVVHAIGQLELTSLFEHGPSEPPYRTRGQRKTHRLQLERARQDLRVSLLCDELGRSVQAYPGAAVSFLRSPSWRRVPRTHASVTCMTCLVLMSQP